MNNNEIIYFWASIMQDHADFILSALSSKETEFIRNAQYFKNEFNKIEKDATLEISNQYIDYIISILNNFIDFKQSIIKRLLSCNIELGLLPSFINHMINEAFEFHRNLLKLRTTNKLEPKKENILLHSIWLPDAAGHAAIITTTLDSVEKIYIKEARMFESIFNEMFIKNFELGKMLERTGLEDGTLNYFNNEVEDRINDFIAFLNKLKNLRMQCKVMGIIKPLMLDHMIREERYFLMNIRNLKK